MCPAAPPLFPAVTVLPSAYNRQYALNRSVPADNWLFDELIMLLAPQKGWRVLDAGCNTGELTARLAGLQCQTLGIDINADAVTLARDRFPQLAFRTADFSQIDETGFDAVIASHIIEHLEKPEEFLRHALGRLRPGGQLAVVTPNRHAWLHKLANRIRGAAFFEDPTHRNLFSPRELVQKARDAGFSSIMVTTQPLYFPLANHLSSGARRKIPALGMGDHLFVIADAPSAQISGITGRLNLKSA